MATTTNAANSPSTGQPSHWRAHGHAAHEVHFYSDEAFLLDPLSRFIGTALGAGDGVLVIATPEHRAALTSALSANGLDASRAISRGRYVELDARETLATLIVDGMPDQGLVAQVVGGAVAGIRQALRTDNSSVAAFGEMVALLWQDGNSKAALRLEHLWNELSHEHLFSLHCAYPMSAFRSEEDAAAFQRICAEHTAVFPDETFSTTAGEDQRLRDVANLQCHLQIYDGLLQTKRQLQSEVDARLQVEQRLRISEEALRALSADLLRTQDEERCRLGRQLHDGIAQYLAAIKMNLDLLRLDVRHVPGAAGQIADCVEFADRSITEIRAISYLLYPPMLEEMGLRTALEWYLHEFAERSKLVITLNVTSGLPRLPRAVELCVFRLVQEALTNVHLHSGSSTAQVFLAEEHGVFHAEIRDQGSGIPPVLLKSAEQSIGMLGVGLRGMDERVRQLGGKLDLSSAPTGVTLAATIPMKQVA